MRVSYEKNLQAISLVWFGLVEGLKQTEARHSNNNFAFSLLFVCVYDSVLARMQTAYYMQFV